jgi:hypothetical protein
MSKDVNRHSNGQFAPSLLGKNPPTPASSLPGLYKPATTPYQRDMSSYYWSNYQGQKRRDTVATENPNLFPAGGSWYEDSSDGDTLVYLYISKGNKEPLRWVQVDRMSGDRYRVLEMTPTGEAEEIMSEGFTS